MSEELDVAAIIAAKLGLERRQVVNVVALLEEGATVPFISRYRKEMTSSLDEVAVKNIADSHSELQALLKRKEVIVQTIRESGQLSEELSGRISRCFDSKELEDLYMPYKPKRRTKASVAKERGLEPLAKIIMSGRCNDLRKTALRFVKEDVISVDEALAGASDIIAEWLSENVSVRRRLRRSVMNRGRIEAKGQAKGTKYEAYENYCNVFAHIPPHAYYALKRAEQEKVLKLSVLPDEERDLAMALERFFPSGLSREVSELAKSAVKDSYKRLLLPSILNETYSDLKERSDEASILLFSENLRQILLAPPIKAQTVLALDPGFRTGCKIVCLSAQGDLLAHDVIYPVEPARKVDEAKRKILSLVNRFNCSVIALGDGTASRETEEFLSSVEELKALRIERVSEQGASIYSASGVARREFPDLDLTFRSAVSIGRRLQDPLAELVKIDPKSIGVGQYQHDVNQTRLKDALDFTVERCVNEVGVNLNTASVELLSHVAGIGDTLARNIVAYRTEYGSFKSRGELKKVPRLGPKAFEQSSGFLRIPGAENPLDNSAVHPERYALVEKMARAVGRSVSDLIGNSSLIASLHPESFVSEEVGLETINDIISELLKPGRDPREAATTSWHNRTIRSIDDVRPGAIITGKVVNITAFGAFVDLGIKQKGLIHISELSDRRVASVTQVLSLQQVVSVKVLSVDTERERISLSLKQAR